MAFHWTQAPLLLMPRSWIKTANNYFSCLAKNDLRLDHFTAIHVFGLSFSFGLNSMKKQTLSYWIWGCTIADWIVFILAFPITVDEYYAVFFVQTKDSSSSTNQSSIPQSSVLLTCKSWRYSVQKGPWHISPDAWSGIHERVVLCRKYLWSTTSQQSFSICGRVKVNTKSINLPESYSHEQQVIHNCFLNRKRIIEEGESVCMAAIPRARVWEDLLGMGWSKWLLSKNLEKHLRN